MHMHWGQTQGLCESSYLQYLKIALHSSFLVKLHQMRLVPSGKKKRKYTVKNLTCEPEISKQQPHAGASPDRQRGQCAFGMFSGEGCTGTNLVLVKGARLTSLNNKVLYLTIEHLQQGQQKHTLPSYPSPMGLDPDPVGPPLEVRVVYSICPITPLCQQTDCDSTGNDTHTYPKNWTGPSRNFTPTPTPSDVNSA